MIAFAVAHRLPAAVKLGLSSDEPPDDVHAMFRGAEFAGGAVDMADLVLGSIERAGGDLGPGTKMLDFGCSSGRVTRVLSAVQPDLELFGCDPNDRAIAWAQRHLAPTFFTSPQVPPLPNWPAHAFDCAFAISVWTHFGEGNALAWLDEMDRLLKPGGLLLLTAGGLANVAVMRDPWGLPDDYIRACSEALNRRGFWWVEAFGEDGDWGVVHPEWGSAYMTPEWLLPRTLSRFALRLYEPGRMMGIQDVYVFERKAT